MHVSIVIDQEDNFKIMEGEFTWAEFKYAPKIGMLREGDALINGESIELKPKTKWWWIFNVGDKKVGIEKNGVEVGEINFTWFRGIIVNILDSLNENRSFNLSNKLLSKSSYFLKDKSGEKLFQLKRDFEILKLKNDYKVEVKTSENYDSWFLMELMMYAIYATNSEATSSVGE